jgi:hypothetical protein
MIRITKCNSTHYQLRKSPVRVWRWFVSPPPPKFAKKYTKNSATKIFLVKKSKKTEGAQKFCPILKPTLKQESDMNYYKVLDSITPELVREETRAVHKGLHYQNGAWEAVITLDLLDPIPYRAIISRYGNVVDIADAQKLDTVKKRIRRYLTR